MLALTGGDADGRVWFCFAVRDGAGSRVGAAVICSVGGFGAIAWVTGAAQDIRNEHAVNISSVPVLSL